MATERACRLFTLIGPFTLGSNSACRSKIMLITSMTACNDRIAYTAWLRSIIALSILIGVRAAIDVAWGD